MDNEASEASIIDEEIIDENDALDAIFPILNTSELLSPILRDLCRCIGICPVEENNNQKQA